MSPDGVPKFVSFGCRSLRHSGAEVCVIRVPKFVSFCNLQGYDEDIAAWAEAVRGWLKQQGLESAAIAQLQQGTGLTLVKLWLAGLLGGFGLRQSGGFYDVEGVVVGVLQ